MDDATEGMFWLVISFLWIMFMGNGIFGWSWWWILLIPMLIIFVTIIVGTAISATHHGMRIHRERKALAVKRRKERETEIAALLRRATTQNEYLHLGMVNDDECKKVMGMFGDFPPPKLDWPESVLRIA